MAFRKSYNGVIVFDFKMRNVMGVNKREIAIMQLCDAIVLFNQEHYVSAITLSGAAEEILAQFILINKAKTGAPMLSAEQIENDMFEVFLDEPDYHKVRSSTRNELKHHSKNDREIVDCDFRQIAINHISGALQNYKVMYKHLPDEKVVKDFCIAIGFS